MTNSINSRFLGPKGENSALLSDLISTALADYVGWRRRYQPRDPSPIHDGDLLDTCTDRGSIKASFLELLGRLHGSVPFFSGHYNAHMLSEQSIAAQAGYFAAMLYNPNNISSEVSPVTTILEIEVAKQLAEMVGYDPQRSWGHLTSGGTIANFEALWIARNVLYHPVAAAGAAKELGVDLSVSLPDGSRARVRDLDLWQLLNLGSTAALDLWDTLWDCAARPSVEDALRARSLSTLGYQDYSRRLSAEFGDPLPPGVVLATATGHYSWEKIVRALGIGANQLVLLPVDQFCRMDTLALWQKVVELSARRVPIMACVAVCGSTEESAIDRLDEIIAVREMAERKLGVTFQIHADACYGGYAAAITRGADNERQSAKQIRAALGDPSWPTEEWVRSVTALEKVDSISIDPHKLGYAPYPAGAFLLKDRRARELVAVDPPYLVPAASDSSDSVFLGRFIFEGSKPGASAAAAWLNHQTAPLNNSAHGRLIASTIAAAHRFHSNLASPSFAPFQVISLPPPDINVVCFLVTHPSLTSLDAVNTLNESIYAELSPNRGNAAGYMISRTRLTSPAYDGAVPAVLTALGGDAKSYWTMKGSEGIVMLRATIMNPFANAERPDYMGGLAAAIRDAAVRCLNKPATVRPPSLASA
ncbi:MAG TPA: pyridoxal-dependent decarboxylase [Gemmatimonadaceae bacterium]|nr:pyridoxal-dependent decarboxylase [Gemmatimonadaceae bacterium]